MPEEEKTETVPMQTMPALALRGLTVYPKMMVHFDVGREASVKAIEESMSSNQPIFLVAQKDIRVEEPDRNHLFAMGTVSVVRQILRLPGKTILRLGQSSVRVMVEGQTRARLHELTQTDPYLVAQVEPVETSEHYEGKTNSLRAEAAIRQAYELFDRYSELSPKNASAEMLMNIMSSEDAGYIADFLAQNVSMRVLDKQSILDELRPVQRLNKMNRLLRREVEILEMEQSIQRRVQENMTQNQKDAFLREQVRVIQEELGEDGDNELAAYRRQIADAKLPEEVETKLLKEVMHLEKQPFGSAEASVLRNYLDVCLELPWTKTSKERVNVQAARKILDADHFGLEKVKERILEFLAVKQLAPDLKGQILCLVGPPGVGKTSIGMSMARALNRKMARISLGGVHDEADIRGHRKTYVGAMPGRIINAIRQAGTRNPLLLLDEIDKLGSDMRGDPAAALLEVLDGEQNSTFRDHFLEVPFDLSDVLFLTTANTTDTIPEPLLNRMEVIQFSGYTATEKFQIARRHLLPKAMESMGIREENLEIPEDVLETIISDYTAEAGVRGLKKRLDTLCRVAAVKMVKEAGEEPAKVEVRKEDLREYLDMRPISHDRILEKKQPGIVTGLAWTQAGGEILFIESLLTKGNGKTIITGQLGNVMKESVQIAVSLVKSMFPDKAELFEHNDLHVHVPAGAVPKDGPSAGITLTTALASLVTGIPVNAEYAMTGEVSLRGVVMPIGGLPEKLMAAQRAGVKQVFIPEENMDDLADVAEEVKQALKIIPVHHVTDVLEQVGIALPAVAAA